MQELIRFILDIFAPEPLLIEGFYPIPEAKRESGKRSLAEVIGLSVHKGGGGKTYVPDPPAPPVINIPAMPAAPIPPPPTSQQSIYNSAQAGREAGAQQAAGFGFSASLLRLPATSGGASSASTGPNGTINTATGTGSLLGLK
jgi:hypothetical protein